MAGAGSDPSHPRKHTMCGEPSPPALSLEPLIVSLTEFRKTVWIFQEGTGKMALGLRPPLVEDLGSITNSYTAAHNHPVPGDLMPSDGL